MGGVIAPPHLLTFAKKSENRLSSQKLNYYDKTIIFIDGAVYNSAHITIYGTGLHY